MSSEITIIAPRTIQESEQLSKTLATSALMPEALRKRPEDVLATLLTGAELGLAPMQAIRGIQIIQGKPSLSADLMGALVKRSTVCEYLQLVESTAAKATYKTKRKGDPEPTTMSFSMQDATAAQLTGSHMYKKYPANMLRARCLAIICRAVYPDLCLGLYDSDSGELTNGQPPEPPPGGGAPPPEREVNAPPPAASTSRTEQVKEKLKRVPVVDVKSGETEAEATERTRQQVVGETTLEKEAREKREAAAKAPTDESTAAMLQLSILQKELGFSGAKMASVIKGASGKADRSQLNLADVAKVKDAVEAIIAAESRAARAPSVEENIPF